MEASTGGLNPLTAFSPTLSIWSMELITAQARHLGMIPSAHPTPSAAASPLRPPAAAPAPSPRDSFPLSGFLAIMSQLASLLLCYLS